ncbi:protein of unknown function (DUF4391) [Brevibacterium sp. 239c]|uniref:DUF4391 domain-containing protein n=1 Tax=Brevibacterium sp. 239c TaxID=1965356 RepID=UPI000C588336|nr:DUF4391 domain-containing protein [Brevibacterium sp. 239c]SMX79183.1 protein of unknown function (DUF4391) [Brevibacterium sp. 239c]
MADLLYKWPVAAKFERRVPKEKFYEKANVSKAVRDRFVSDVQRITWAYKLAESTINLSGNDAVPEVQVFRLDVKKDDLSDLVLTAIDKAIQYPIIFEIARTLDAEPQVRLVAAHKRLGAGTPKLSSYYTTGWQAAGAERHPLPVAVSLPALYGALLEPLIPVTLRPDEEMSEVADRLSAVRMLEREIAVLERRLRTEPQLNRKIDLRRILKTKQTQLKQQR